jgi:hypothetical protein
MNIAVVFLKPRKNFSKEKCRSQIFKLSKK